jgi:predicted ester cyclase
MQKLPDFFPTFSHHLKPVTCDGSQFACMLFNPRIDRGIMLDSAVESQQVRVHRRRFSVFEIYGYVQATGLA